MSDERQERAIQHLIDTGIPRDQAERMIFKQHEREDAALLMLGSDSDYVVLHRETVTAIFIILESLSRDGDGSQETADILLDVEDMARDAVNILPHLKLALRRDEAMGCIEPPRGWMGDRPATEREADE